MPGSTNVTISIGGTSGHAIRVAATAWQIGSDDRLPDSLRKSAKTGRLWAYLGDRDNRFVVYDYTPTWGAEGPERFLNAYRSGYLQSDGYAGYDRLHARGLVEVGCWATSRSPTSAMCSIG